MTQKRLPNQKIIIAAIVLLFLIVSFVLETTGALDWLYKKAGLQDAAALPQGVIEVHYIDVDNADSAFITCGGQTLLIDAGTRDTDDELVAYLKSHGVQKLDYVIATYADSDHIGGMRTVVNTFPIGEYLMSYMPEGLEPTTSTYINLLTALDKNHVPVTDVKVGETYALGDATVTILGPVEDGEDTNNQSVVCRIDFKNNRFLFVGDAEKSEENSLLSSNADLRADVLKVGHHGSSSSSSAKFLKAVSPQYGVISCGKDNSYGHPHKEALERLKKAGIQIYRTDERGTVVITGDGQSLTCKTERQEASE